MSHPHEKLHHAVTRILDVLAFRVTRNVDELVKLHDVTFNTLAPRVNVCVPVALEKVVQVIVCPFVFNVQFVIPIPAVLTSVSCIVYVHPGALKVSVLAQVFPAVVIVYVLLPSNIYC